MASEELRIIVTKRKGATGRVALTISCTRDIEYEDGIASVDETFDPNEEDAAGIENDPEYRKMLAVVSDAMKRLVLMKLY